MKKIKIGIIGVGNCASSLIQGLQYYKNKDEKSVGLMHWSIGGYTPDDIEVVCAFDVDERKVGKNMMQFLNNQIVQKYFKIILMVVIVS